ERAGLPDDIVIIRRGVAAHADVDRGQISQILLNLVTNAGQAMPDGGTLTIETGSDERGSWIAVSDTGVGIAPEDRAKIFQPLFTTKAKGIGLGLAIARNLAEANGGALTVEGEPGRGSRFVLSFSTRG